MSTKILDSIVPQIDSEDNEFVAIDKELEPEDSGVEDGSDQDLSHSRLLTDISLLDSRNKKTLKWKASRFEANEDINEFNLTKSKKRLTINDLIRSVKNADTGIKKLRHWHKKKLLESPLEKPIAEQIKRTVAYNEARNELSKWDPLVESNRNAPQMHFPLKQSVLSLEPARELVKQYEPKTKLEIEVSELLKKSDNAVNDDTALTVAEEKILKAMSLEEAKIRHRELQRMRALMSYQEVRLKRQSKIKSKKYHRILKKEKLKKSLEQFESEAKSEPQIAIEKLDELEKLRALERASLRHKNTGKWAKHLKLRSKYDDTARKALTEQLHINNKLMQKKVHFESDDEIDDNNEQNSSEGEALEGEDVAKDEEFESLPTDYNPWMRSGRQSRPKPQTIERELNDRPINFETSGADTEANETINFESSGANNGTDETIEDNELNKSLSKTEDNTNEKQTESQSEVHIDPNDFISIKSHKLKSALPDVVTELDSDDESVASEASDEEQKKLVSEAFADDDVINDFKKDKLEKIENEGQKDINLHLPGWGSWAGVGIKQSKRKIRQFTFKAKKKQRKDMTLGNVIISEKKDETIAKYRVNNLPFPFKNVVQYENSIRQPIGRTWNSETSFRHLTEPKIVTKMGTIIEPIDSEALVKSKIDNKSVSIKRRVKKKSNKVKK